LQELKDTIPVNPEVERTKNGKIIVNEFCQIDHYPNVFSIGDIAAVKDWDGKLYPPLAHIAVS
jgi:NADH dehydrogenase